MLLRRPELTTKRVWLLAVLGCIAIELLAVVGLGLGIAELLR